MENNNLNLFRSITEDFDIKDSEIVKFLEWGKGDIQQALNYYFRKKEKSKSNTYKNNDLIKGELKPTNKYVETTKAEKNKTEKNKTEKKLIHHNNNVEYIQEVKEVEESAAAEESVEESKLSNQPTKEEITLFDKMKNASIKQKKVETFIEIVRKQYELPINGKYLNNNKNEKQYIVDDGVVKDVDDYVYDNDDYDDYEVEKEFEYADNLKNVFGNEGGDGDGFDVDLEEEHEEKEEELLDEEFQRLDELEEEEEKKSNKMNYKNDIKEKMEIEKPTKTTKTTKVAKQTKTSTSTTTTINRIQTRSIKNNTFHHQQEQQPELTTFQTKEKKVVIIKEKEPFVKKSYQTQQPEQNESSLLKFEEAPIFNKSQKQNNLNPNPNLNLKMLESMPSEIYLGEYFYQGFKTDTEPFPQKLEIGVDVDFRHYMEPEKKKKTFNKSTKSTKTTTNIVNMRIVFNNKEICRVEDHEARILVPLITRNMIRIENSLFELPEIINTFSKVKLIARVYLRKKALTVPVVETYNGQSEEIVSLYKGIGEEISGLLERLNLKIIKYPLIKNKSKYSRNNNNINVKKSTTTKLNEEEFKKKSLELKKKEEDFNYRKQNDPFFKIKQVNIVDMMKANSEKDINCSTTLGLVKKEVLNDNVVADNENAEISTNNNQVNKSEIKKKVIELVDEAEENKYSELIDLYEEDEFSAYYPEKGCFQSELYHYQAIALAWMMKREGNEHLLTGPAEKLGHDKVISEEEIHPLWTEYQLPDSNQSLFYNELTSQTSLLKPIMKNRCKGGILADEMGLGKTVMMASLIAASVEKVVKTNQAQSLVIVPLTLLSQWEAEIKKHTKGLSVVCYYTSERHKIVNELPHYNVVVTTYGTVSHEFTKTSSLKKVGLYRYKWKRIILDEAHYIKGRIIQTSKAVYNLEGECRWCLTGTPIQNGLNDLFSLVHFIKYAPWSEFECWQKYITKAHEEGDENVYDALRTILKKVFLRRTKQSKDHEGKSIVELPKKHSRIEVLEMNPKERKLYDMVYESTKAKLDELEKLGIITAKYMQVLEILIKLRQVCCHSLLFKSITKFTQNPLNFESDLRKFIKKRESIQNQKEINSEENYYEPIIEGEEELRVEISQENKKISEGYLKETIDKIIKQDLENCLICMDDAEDPVITSCLHIFCKTCMIRQIEEFGNCASCRKLMTKEDFLHLPRENRFNFSLESEEYERSSKMIALMEYLKAMEKDDKAVVFSQFLGMLDLLEHDFKKNAIRFVRMEGSTPQKERARIISDFSNNPEVKVFLVSLKTAGVGLNLVAANKVFLMDPWWNPGVEDQAIERVHRIGQKKEVEIVRFIMDKTIEMRMVELNNQKKHLSQMVLTHKDTDNESKMDKLRYLMEKY